MSIRDRYRSAGNWYKGNTHIHTVASDGGKTVAELTDLYSGQGYEFLFCTDHRAASDFKAKPANGPVLWMDGIELDGSDTHGGNYHVVCLGSITGYDRDMPFLQAMDLARSQNALLVLAHPHWCGNSFDDANRHGFDGVEIYNHIAQWLNGKGDGRAYWEAMLKLSPFTLAFAADDAHVSREHPGWNGGWIVVNAPELSSAAILAAIRHGNYYSSCGPSFEKIEFDGRRIKVATSPVQFMRMVGPAYLGERRGTFDAGPVTEALFEVPNNWPYAYIEIEDAQGRRAWTNTMMRV